MQKCRSGRGPFGGITISIGRLIKKNTSIKKYGRTDTRLSRQTLHSCFLPPFGTTVRTKYVAVVPKRGSVTKIPIRTSG